MRFLLVFNSKYNEFAIFHREILWIFVFNSNKFSSNFYVFKNFGSTFFNFIQICSIKSLFINRTTRLSPKVLENNTNLAQKSVIEGQTLSQRRKPKLETLTIVLKMDQRFLQNLENLVIQTTDIKTSMAWINNKFSFKFSRFSEEKKSISKMWYFFSK